jgi:hypothetical protein
MYSKNKSLSVGANWPGIHLSLRLPKYKPEDVALWPRQLFAAPNQKIGPDELMPDSMLACTHELRTSTTAVLQTESQIEVQCIAWCFLHIFLGTENHVLFPPYINKIQHMFKRQG